MTEKRQIGALEATIEGKQVGLEDLWSSRKNAAEAEEKNLESWRQNLNDDQRRVICHMVLHALKTLADDTEWIPYSTTVRDGEVVEVNFKVLLTDIDMEVQKQEAELLKTIEKIRKDPGLVE